LQKLLFTV